MSTIAETLAQVRKTLNEMGVPEIPVTVALRDQAQASFRSDLVYMGLDPAGEGVLESALAGLVVGMKLNIQQNIPSILISQYVSIAECVLAMLAADHVDISDLPDPGFDEMFASLRLPDAVEVEVESVPACARCGTAPAVLGLWCVSCAQKLMADIGRQLGSRPQVGGPGFNRGPDGRFEPEADVGPQNRWARLMDTQIKDLFKRKR